eukprot:PhF_6_TR7360/c0_g1_i1/m.11079
MSMDHVIKQATAYFSQVQSVCITVVKATDYERHLLLSPPRRSSSRASKDEITHRFYGRLFEANITPTLSSLFPVFPKKALETEYRSLGSGLHCLLYCELSIQGLVSMNDEFSLDMILKMLTNGSNHCTLQCKMDDGQDIIAVRNLEDVRPIALVTVYIHPQWPTPHPTIKTPPTKRRVLTSASPTMSTSPRRSTSLVAQKSLAIVGDISTLCARHGITMNHFCLDDNTCVCAECILEMHQGHKTVMKDVRAAFVEGLSATVAKKEKELRQYMQSADVLKESQTEAQDSAIEFVNVQFKVLLEMLEVKRNQLIDRIKGRHDEQVKEISRRRGVAETVVSTLSSVLLKDNPYGEGLEAALSYSPSGLPPLMDVDVKIDAVAKSIEHGMTFVDNTPAVAPSPTTHSTSTVLIIGGENSGMKEFLEEVGSIVIITSPAGEKRSVLLTTTHGAPYDAILLLYAVSDRSSYEVLRAHFIPSLLIGNAVPIAIVGTNYVPQPKEVFESNLHDFINRRTMGNFRSKSFELEPAKQKDRNPLVPVLQWIFE